LDLSNNFVPGDGPETAIVMILGEAPGENEDKQGRPFVGRAGKLLDETLAIAGLPRKDVYVTNVVPYRPANNATPDQDLIRKYTREHLIPEYKKVKPIFVLLLGNTALRAATMFDGGITKHRGWIDYHDHIFPDSTNVYATLHPSAALRSSGNKHIFELDVKVFAASAKIFQRV
jgi:uracil-DNA glycosylase family 4